MTTLRLLVGALASLLLAATGCGRGEPHSARDQQAVLVEAKRFAALQSGGDAGVEAQLAEMKAAMIRSAKVSPNAQRQEALKPGLIDYVTAAVIKEIRPLLRSENTKADGEIANKAADFFTYEELRQINAYSQSNAAQLVAAAIGQESKPWPTTPDRRPVPYSVGIKRYETELPTSRLDGLSAEDLRTRQRFDASPTNARLGAFLPVLGDVRRRTAEEFLRLSAPIVSRAMAEAEMAFLKQPTVSR